MKTIHNTGLWRTAPILLLTIAAAGACAGRDAAREPAQCSLRDLPFLASDSTIIMSFEDSESPTGEIAGFLDAGEFSFGLDWIPIDSARGPGGEWRLENFDDDTPDDAKEAGFGVIFFGAGGSLRAFSWGPHLDSVFPGVRDHTELRTDMRWRSRHFGLDFNGWAAGVGFPGTACYMPPKPDTKAAIYWFGHTGLDLFTLPIVGGVLAGEQEVRELSSDQAWKDWEDRPAALQLPDASIHVTAFALDLEHGFMILGFGLDTPDSHDFYAMGITYDKSADGRVGGIALDPSRPPAPLLGPAPPSGPAPLAGPGGGGISPVRPVTSCSSIDPRLLRRAQRPQ